MTIFCTVLKFAVSKQDTFLKSRIIQSYTYRVLQTIQIKLILLCVWARDSRRMSYEPIKKMSLSLHISPTDLDGMYVYRQKIGITDQNIVNF